MRNVRGILAGALALVALHTLVAYQDANKRIARLVDHNGIFVGAVIRFLDPTVPAIADHRKPKAEGTRTTSAAGGDASRLLPDPRSLRTTTT